MNWVTEQIAVGGHNDLHPNIMEAHGITHLLIVIPLKEDLLHVWFRKLERVVGKLLLAPWHDDSNLNELYEALGFIDEAVNSGGRVLVACGAGIERAPTTVVAYLVYKGASLDDAVNYVRGAHPASMIRVHWLEDVGFNVGLYPEVF